PAELDDVYGPLLGNPSFEAAPLHTDGYANTYAATRDWIEASDNAGRVWIVTSTEVDPPSIGTPPDGADDPYQANLRKYVLWGNLMAGGAGTEWYFGSQWADNDQKTEDLRTRDRMWDYSRHALTFFHDHLPFWDMDVADGLTAATDDHVLAKAGAVYAVYLPDGGTTTITLPSGDYAVRWFDPRDGGALQTGSVADVSGGGSPSIGQPPSDPTSDWAVLLTAASTPPPAVLSLSPNQFDVTVEEDATTPRTLTVANVAPTGAETLSYTAQVLEDASPTSTAGGAGRTRLAAADAARSTLPVTLDAPSGTVAPGMQADLTVTFDASGLAPGTYAYTIEVSTNAGDDSVPIALTVEPACAPSWGVALTLTDGDGHVRTLELGTRPGASDDYDPGCDAVSPGYPGDGFYAAIRGTLAGNPEDYFRDYRAELDAAPFGFHVWELTLEGAAGAVSVTAADAAAVGSALDRADGSAVSESLTLPPASELYLAGGTGVPAPVDLSALVSSGGAATLPAGATMAYVALAPEATYERAFPWGFSMLGPALAGLGPYDGALDPAPSQAPLAYDGGAYYEAAELEAERGAWAFYFRGGSAEPGPGTATLTGYARPAMAHPVDEAWELVAFPACALLSGPGGGGAPLSAGDLAVEPAGAVHGELYTWDDAAGAYAAVCGADPLEAGRAYWLFRVSGSAAVVRADCRAAGATAAAARSASPSANR
ncbi:MAG: putative collagen-binding domain-containing protein, partial [Rhodothermales bacterium]|nr:putative collagen-binding domain-containing protein [Rhodothermales bacterium]